MVKDGPEATPLELTNREKRKAAAGRGMRAMANIMANSENDDAVLAQLQRARGVLEELEALTQKKTREQPKRHPGSGNLPRGDQGVTTHPWFKKP